jgi:carboxypeptidase C (cathepsin A)
MAMYPEYKSRQFILAGESYGGKYLPHIALRLKQHYDLDRFENFTTVLIGNPQTSPIKQRLTTDIIGKGSNTVDSSMLN